MFIKKAIDWKLVVKDCMSVKKDDSIIFFVSEMKIVLKFLVECCQNQCNIQVVKNVFEFMFKKYRESWK